MDSVSGRGLQIRRAALRRVRSRSRCCSASIRIQSSNCSTFPTGVRQNALGHCKNLCFCFGSEVFSPKHTGNQRAYNVPIVVPECLRITWTSFCTAPVSCVCTEPSQVLYIHRLRHSYVASPTEGEVDKSSDPIIWLPSRVPNVTRLLGRL